jgi:hypothetical protein
MIDYDSLLMVDFYYTNNQFVSKYQLSTLRNKERILMLSSLVAALLVSMLYLLLVVLSFHFLKVKRPLLVMGFLFLICLPLLLVLHHYYFAPLHLAVPVSFQMQTALLSALLFSFFYYGYMQIYGLIDFSISFRILFHMITSENGTLSIGDIKAIYPMDEVILRKIELAVKYGLIKEEVVGGERILSNKNIWNVVGRGSEKAKNFLNWGPGG